MTLKIVYESLQLQADHFNFYARTNSSYITQPDIGIIFSSRLPKAHLSHTLSPSLKNVDSKEHLGSSAKLFLLLKKRMEMVKWDLRGQILVLIDGQGVIVSQRLFTAW